MNGNDVELRDAILAAALEQELRGESPPDLADRVLAAAEHRATSRPAGAMARWPIAALVLLALSLVVTVWAWPTGSPDDRGGRSDGADEPTGWYRDLIVPESPAEAGRLIAAAAAVEAKVFAVRDPATDRLVRIEDHPLENLLAPLFVAEKPVPEVRADAFQLVDWSAAVQGVLARAARDGRPDAACPLELRFEIPDRGTLVVGIDDTREPVVLRVRGLPLAWQLPAADRLPASLRSVLDEPLRVAIEGRGIAIGSHGLARLPDSATRIRAVSLTATDLSTLSRFEDLTSLDLSLSEAAVAPAALAGLRLCPELRSLVLPDAGIGAEHLVPIVELPALRELFLGRPRWELWRSPWPHVVNQLDDRCAELLTRASRLTELWMPVTRLTDAGLARLATLPLRALCVGSSQVTGVGFDAFRDAVELRQLSLIGCEALTVRGFRSLATALRHRDRASRPAVEVILCDGPVAEPGLEALLTDGGLRKLGLVRCRPSGGWPSLFGTIASAGALERLELTVDAGFRLDDLATLAAATHLRKLEVAVVGDQPDLQAAIERVRAALPGVGLDVFRMP